MPNTAISLIIPNTDNIEAHLSREWLETNGLGGYASSTIINCHTRKYHGLLVANLDKPGGRFVLLSKLEDSLSFNGQDFFLSIHKYPFTYCPSKLPCQIQFSRHLCPKFSFSYADMVLQKEYMVLHKENTLLVRYFLEKSACPVHLIVKPLLAYRNIHELSHENSFIKPFLYEKKGGFSIAPYDGMPELHIHTDSPTTIDVHPLWYHNFEYSKERERGFAYHEDLFMPAVLQLELQQGEEVIFFISLQKPDYAIAEYWKKEVIRREKEQLEDQTFSKKETTLLPLLRSAARQFIISNRKNKPSILAGYHWFYEWGRDLLISLPGLTFYTDHVSEGIEILKYTGGLRKNGVIPNCLSESNEDASFNSADASLWYFWCVQELLKKTGSLELVKKDFWPVLKDIVTHYYYEKSEFTSITEDGLLEVGNATTQLTWMDASVNGIPVTPRNGCPIEINALWFNALCFSRQLSESLDSPLDFDINTIIEKMSQSFMRCFWLEDKHYLADLWMPDKNRKDDSLRPNQLFAVSLPYRILNKPHARMIIDIIRKHLLTPYGLRTLAPFHDEYCGQYAGIPEIRDTRYHQGTVWPWLLGHYGDALLFLSPDKKKARRELQEIISSLEMHIYHEACLGQISEIFDGDEPHRPHGCIAQAWSVAEAIRLTSLLY